MSAVEWGERVVVYRMHAPGFLGGQMVTPRPFQKPRVLCCRKILLEFLLCPVDPVDTITTSSTNTFQGFNDDRASNNDNRRSAVSRDIMPRSNDGNQLPVDGDSSDIVVQELQIPVRTQG
jgi:hypothetical protein